MIQGFGVKNTPLNAQNLNENKERWDQSNIDIKFQSGHSDVTHLPDPDSTSFHLLQSEQLDLCWSLSPSLYHHTSTVCVNWAKTSHTLCACFMTLSSVSGPQPCHLKDWELHVQFKVHGSGKKNLHGDGIAIWYTKDRLHTGNVGCFSHTHK